MVRGSTLPSTFGTMLPVLWLARIVAIGSARRHAAVWSVQPARVANAAPAASAAASEGYASE
jgi:hypothetical protein